MNRRRSETDRRQVRLEATDSARERGFEIFAPMVDELLAVVEQHSEEEVRTFSVFIQELRDAMVRAREKGLAEDRGSGAA